MKMETDPKVIERLAREREEENWEFRRFLKDLPIEDEELDAMVHRHFEEVSSQVDCCACANCCREVLPLLSTFDVERLAGGLKISGEELIERFLVPGEETGTFTFNSKPCPMLLENRCTVYESRPEDCRSFPHLHKDEFVFRLIQAVQNCSICPIVFHVFERLKSDLLSEARRWDGLMDEELEELAFENFETWKRESLIDQVDEVFRDHPDDYVARLEELGFQYFDDDEDFEKEEEREAEPQNRRQRILVDYFEGRRKWSGDLLNAFMEEKDSEETNYALIRRYFRQGNRNLKSLLLQGLEHRPDRVVDFLMDLSFFHEFENILRELIEKYTEACVKQVDLDIFTELAQDFYDATILDGYEAYPALRELFEPESEKRKIVDFLMAEEAGGSGNVHC